MLEKPERYLEAGVHIGTRFITGDMRPYVFKARQNGLYVLDVEKIDRKMEAAVKLLSRYQPQDILVVASRLYASTPAKKFAQAIGCKVMTGRFLPGTLTNPHAKTFVEPKIVLVSDPLADRQAVKEAGEMNIPIIAFCDTNNTTHYVDLVVPLNNKGRKSLAFTFWLLARELLKMKGREIEEDWKDWMYQLKRSR